MATQKGLLKMEGSLDDITFYRRKGKYIAKTRGSISKSRIMTDPSFARTRENIEEFGMLCTSSKLLRSAGAALTRRAYDGTLHNRLVGQLNQVKKLDLTSLRGKRHVQQGLGTAQGRAVIKGLELNSRTPLSTVLSAPFSVDAATGAITITGLVPAEMLTPPEHATHVTLQSAMVNIDFLSRLFDITYSQEVNLPIDYTSATQVLTPSAVPTGTGTVLHLLLVEFTQEVNGVQYALNNGNFNALTVVEVG